MVIDYSLFSDKGGRELNEDCVCVAKTEHGFCAVLCDGLGGHEGGELASQQVCGLIKERFESWDGRSELREFISQAVMEAQQGLLELQRQLNKPGGLKTTLCLLAVCDGKALALHVGDSRVYRFRHSFVTGRSLDHSLPQFLVQSGEIKESQIRCHPERNKLLRVMGVEWDSPQFQLWELPELRGGDAYLLCSDGFWEWIEEKQMQRFLRRSSESEQWLSQMCSHIEKNGPAEGRDNFSAIAVKIK